MDDQQEATGQAEPSWLDTYTEAWDRIRATRALDGLLVTNVAFDQSMDHIEIRFASGKDAGEAARRLHLGTHDQRPVGDVWTVHEWTGKVDGVHVRIATYQQATVVAS